MKLIIAGSRDTKEDPFLLVAKAIYYYDFTPYEVVCGGARGIDLAGRAWARWNSIPVAMFPANWDKHGKSAGYKRNIEMAEYADCLLAIWDGQSKGTKHMVDIMNKKGKPVYVYRTDEHQ